MIDISRKLSDEGIKIKDFVDGNQKTKCPKCQPPHNRNDNPLSVTIEGSTVLWKCHHCEWSGGFGEKSFQKPSSFKIPKLPEKPFQQSAHSIALSTVNCLDV